LPDSLPDFLFIAVHIGRVNQASAVCQQRFDGIDTGIISSA
jgi:hypothetical protein